MALTIDMEECTSCGVCEPVCPTQAISHHEKTFLITAKACTECQGGDNTPQCVLVCPVDCIQPAIPTPPISTVKRAKLYQQVVKLVDRPETIFFN
jgi:ferredoxin